MVRLLAAFRRGPMKALIGLCTLAAALFTVSAQAADVQVAVAANFTEPAKDIAAAFEKKTGTHVIMSFGASGAFFSQIEQGAPFEVFLSADENAPIKLETDGFGIRGKRASSMPMASWCCGAPRPAWSTAKAPSSAGGHFDSSGDRRSGRRVAVRCRRRRNPEKAEPLRHAAAQDRQGHLDRPGLHLRAIEGRRPRLRRPVAGHQTGRRLGMDRAARRLYADRPAGDPAEARRANDPAAKAFLDFPQVTPGAWPIIKSYVATK